VRVEALLWLVVACAMLAWTGASLSKEAAPAAADPVLEQRTMELAGQLRCLVCQNQTIADSNAPLAVDLKNQIREQLQKGASNADIVDFMVARYGDFVLYRPPFRAATVLLWLGPLLLLAAGLAWLYRLLRRRTSAADVELTEADRKRARALLAQAEKDAP
jgi:cytochrome c-type biogenesis protein CcmH